MFGGLEATQFVFAAQFSEDLREGARDSMPFECVFGKEGASDSMAPVCLLS